MPEMLRRAKRTCIRCRVSCLAAYRMGSARAAHGAGTRGCPVRSNPTGLPSARRLALVLRGVLVGGLAPWRGVRLGPCSARASPTKRVPGKSLTYTHQKIVKHDATCAEHAARARRRPTSDPEPEPPTAFSGSRDTRTHVQAPRALIQARKRTPGAEPWARGDAQGTASGQPPSPRRAPPGGFAQSLPKSLRHTLEEEYLAAARPQPWLAPLR